MRLGNIMGGFAAGVPLGMKMSDAFDEARRRKELADAASAQPETIVTQKPGADTTPGVDGKIYDSDTGLYVSKFMGWDGQPTEQAQAQLNATPEAPSAPVETVLPSFATETSKRYRMGDKEQETPFTPAQIGMQRVKSMSDVALRHGDPVQAARFETLAATRRDAADQEEIRSTLAGTPPVGLSHVRPFVNDKGGAPMSAQGDATNPAAQGLQRQGSYLETVGPRVMDTYLKQGKIAEAKAWRDFIESESGHAYANDFAQAQRLVTVGDYDTAAPILEKLYNRGYPDGRQVKLTSVGDGNFKADVVDQKSGQLIGSKTMPAPDMGKMAISALAPTKLVEFMAQQQGKREAEGSTLSRQLELERLRQEGADVRDDRREERLQTRLDAQTANLERRLSAGGGLTVPQQRTNDAIDAARTQLSGMSQAEILRKTQSSLSSGRTNPDFDVNLSRAAKLANSRKYGTDEEHDAFSSGRSDANAESRGDTFSGKPLTDLTDGQLQQFSNVAGPEAKAKIKMETTRRRFLGDQRMSGYRLGPIDPKKGLPLVLDKSGTPVGHYE